MNRDAEAEIARLVARVKELKQEIERLRAAIRDYFEMQNSDVIDAMQEARAALAEPKEER